MSFDHKPAAPVDLDAIRVGDSVRVTFTRDDNREHAEITGDVVATTRVGLVARDSIRIHPHGDYPGSIRIYDDGSVVGVEPGDRLDVVLGNRAEIHRIDDGPDGEAEPVADGGLDRVECSECGVEVPAYATRVEDGSRYCAVCGPDAPLGGGR